MIRRMSAVTSLMCLSSLVTYFGADIDACEKNPIMWRALANKNVNIWESHVSESCFGTRSQEKGILIIIFSPRAQRPLAAKGLDFFRGQYGHTVGGCHRDMQDIIKRLSNLWMRDWWSVCSLCKKQSRAHAFHVISFKWSFESHHAALECIQNLNI
jgi:hypothetical protein